MRAQAGTTGRSEAWFEAYIALGPGRSLRKLIAESQQIATRNGLGKPPSEATIFRWSSKLGWDRRAKQHDREASERERAHLLRRRADLAEQRLELALEHSMRFHRLVRSALTVEEPVLDADGQQRIEVHADGSLTPLTTYRSATFRELSKQDVTAVIALHNAAVGTERTLLAGAADRYQQYADELGGGDVGVTILGPEAIQELGIKVGHLVRHLAAATGRRRQEAEMRVIEHNPDEDETDYGDEDEESGVVLEELDDDE